ncbi:MAG: VWA domain-containing protein [Acidobacteriaceae bacterium]|nr:VWA domain-containing protein [Acidobacteriaceae bacterium]
MKQHRRLSRSNSAVISVANFILFVTALGSLCVAQIPKPPWASSASADAKDSSASQTDTTFKVNVKLVNVFVTVTDEHGAPIGGLTKDNFEVQEDGAPQTIAVFGKESALPLSIVMDIDTSLSTRKDLPLELNSARHFAHAILRPVDALSLFEFGEVVNELVRFTSDLKTIDRGIDHPRFGAGTALYDAVYLGSRSLQTRQGRKVMVVITDGGDTVSRVDYQQALRAAQEAEAIVYSVIDVPVEASAGRDTGGEHALIQLSEDTGGKYFYATSVPELDEAFHKISDELRTQYLLAYYPTQRLANSDFRRVQVKVKGFSSDGRLVVRHRTGYYTTKSKS